MRRDDTDSQERTHSLTLDIYQPATPRPPLESILRSIIRPVVSHTPHFTLPGQQQPKRFPWFRAAKPYELFNTAEQLRHMPRESAKRNTGRRMSCSVSCIFTDHTTGHTRTSASRREPPASAIRRRVVRNGQSTSRVASRNSVAWSRYAKWQ